VGCRDYTEGALEDEASAMGGSQKFALNMSATWGQPVLFAIPIKFRLGRSLNQFLFYAMLGMGFMPTIAYPP